MILDYMYLDYEFFNHLTKNKTVENGSQARSSPLEK